MSIKIPKYERRVMPQVGNVPSPVFPAPVRAAFGEQTAKAQGEMAKAGQRLAGVLAARASRKAKVENDRYISELDTQFRVAAQDFLFNQDEEAYIKDGQKLRRPRGVLNRNLSQADGSTYDFDSWYKENRDKYLQNVQSAEHNVMLARSMDGHFTSLRNNVIGHEIKQGRLNIETSLTANINQKISDGFMKQDPISLVYAIEDIKVSQDALNDFNGYDKGVSELKTRAVINHLTDNAIQGALATDATGTKATILLKSIKDELHAEDYEEAQNVIKKQMKVNSRLVEDVLFNKELLGELTLEEIYANSQPREQGGIGPAKANTIKNRLLKQQKVQLKDIQEDAQGAEEYLKLVDQTFDNQIEIFNAKQILVDAFADGVVDKEEVNKIKKIKENMQLIKWNKESHPLRNAWREIISFGNWNNLSDQELAVQTRELINSVDNGENPEEAVTEILRNAYNSLNAGNPIGKDEDVRQRINTEVEEKIEVEKEGNLSFDFNKLNPFMVTEASALEKGMKNIKQEPFKDEYDSLTLSEKLLSGSIGNKITDILTGGMSLQEADDMWRVAKEGWATLPKDIFDVSKTMLMDIGEDVQNAKSFLLNPIGAINEAIRFKTDEEVQMLAQKYRRENEPFLRVLGRIFTPIGRVIESTRATIGEAVEGKDVAEILEGGVKGFLKPEEVETIASKVPLREWERSGATKAGSVVRLLPRAVAEAVETYVIAELTLGLPSKMKQLKGVAAEKEVTRVFNKVRKSPEMRKDFTEWMASRGAFNKSTIGGDIKQITDDALNLMEIRVRNNPKLMGELAKNQTLGKMLKDKLSSETGTLDFFPKSSIVKIEGKDLNAVIRKQSGKWQVVFLKNDGTLTGDITKETYPEALKEAQVMTGVAKEDLVKIIPRVPDFKKTEEAIAFGKKATPEQVEALKVKREEILAQNKELMAKEDPTDAELQEGMDLAVKGQFYREAIEAGEGRFKEVKLEQKEITPGIPSKEEITQVPDEQFVEHLKGMDKSGLQYSKKIEIEETGETVEITKDVSEVLRENSKAESAYKQFLECISKL